MKCNYFIVCRHIANNGMSVNLNDFYATVVAMFSLHLRLKLMRILSGNENKNK